MNPLLNLFFLCWLGSVGDLSAQQKLMIRGTAPDFFLEHKVLAKENWYSVGRVYNVAAAEIARFNKLKLSQSLKVGQLLKVPLGPANFSQDGEKTRNDLLIPLFHQVNANEWMYRISVTYNKVPIPRLEKWNHLTNDQLHPGLELIVGYLKVRKGVSTLTAGSSSGDVAYDQSPKEQVKSQQATKPAESSIGTADDGTRLSSVDHTAGSARAENIQTAKPVALNFKGGVFKKQYIGGQKSLTGNAGIFRSTSGWNDGKYYALINDVPAGTIIKVFFSSTNKSIYAKVLGPLPEMKESVGLSLRLSDASASELDIALPKFFVEVSY